MQNMIGDITSIKHHKGNQKGMAQKSNLTTKVNNKGDQKGMA